MARSLAWLSTLSVISEKSIATSSFMSGQPVRGMGGRRAGVGPRTLLGGIRRTVNRRRDSDPDPAAGGTERSEKTCHPWLNIPDTECQETLSLKMGDDGRTQYGRG
ncbi:protein of unknown function [Methylococcus capsulatus]|uniref:Uncharacterized protein n=1 Tax=Methylococcus capsulatus TaxID=414 RepID=A0AA35XUL4_METCP|nr:protein of unknown function [Methylococcus capsulatus]